MKTVSGWIFVLALGLGSAEAQETKKASVAVKIAPAPAVKAAPATQPVLPPAPTDATEAAKVAAEAAKAVGAKNYWYFSALVVLLLMFFLKATKVLEKLGRWKYTVPAGLSLAAGFLSAAQGGLTWSEAFGVFTAAWSTSAVQQLVEHGILGKPHTGASTGSVG